MGGEKNIDLRFISKEESAEGLFDSEKLEKIMNNLLSNALKFTSEGGKVIVTLRQAQGNEQESRHKSFTIFVTDTGPGIPSEHLPNIFNRFYRADNSHAVEGTGIGLALVWELIQLHHGTVTVESTTGVGSQFTVSIPIDESAYIPEEIATSLIPHEEREKVGVAEHSSEDKPLVSIPAAHGKPIVLVVEDNADLRSYIREFLIRDYVVHEAGDGRAGLECAFETIPDIVISDVMMPKMDGIQMCRALKDDVRTSHVPVILLTARAGTDSKIEGLEIGADDYVTKPFDSKELLARVKNLIEQRKQLRKKFSAGVVLKPGEVAVTSMDDVLLKKVMQCVEKNIGDENFSVEDLAAEACLSRSQLSRKLQALTNLSPIEIIRYVRLQRAHELLEKKAGNISDIAYQVGFSSQTYFSTCFRERFGYSPSEIHRK